LSNYIRKKHQSDLGKYLALYCLYLVVLECKMMMEKIKREHKQLCAQNEAASYHSFVHFVE